MKYIITALMLVFLTGCDLPWASKAKPKATTTQASRVSEEAVGGQASEAPEDCAITAGERKFCTEDRLSKYFLHNKSQDFMSRFTERTVRETNLSETEKLVEYSVEQASRCRRYNPAAEEYCDIIVEHSVALEDTSVLFYRALVIFEGMPGNDFKGKVITKYRPIFDQHEIIDWYYKNYVQNDIEYHPDAASLRDAWKSGKSKYSDYEYYLAVHGKCIADSQTLEQDFDFCEEMSTEVEDLVRQNKKDKIQIVADWHYIVAIYQPQ
jgi:hypothetical protein